VRSRMLRLVSRRRMGSRAWRTRYDVMITTTAKNDIHGCEGALGRIGDFM